MTVKDGHLDFQRQGAGAVFRRLPLAAGRVPSGRGTPTQLADRLARSGINLVRLGDLDTAYGPDRSLFDDSRDDTKELDPVALERLDHLIAELEETGNLRGDRARRASADSERMTGSRSGLLPSGGGPAAMFDPKIGQLALASAKALLGHRNPETELALKEDPALAWVTLAG